MPEFEAPSDDAVAAAGAAMRERAAARARSRRAVDSAPPAVVTTAGPPAAPPRSGSRSVRLGVLGSGPPRRRLRALRRSPIVAFAVGLILTAVPIVAVPTAVAAAQQAKRDDAVAILDRYVDAVAAGDVELARALEDLPADVADDTLVAAGVRPSEPADLDCDRPALRADVATMRCSVSAGEYGSSDAVVAARFVQGRWRILSGLAGSGAISTSLERVTSIGGVAIPAEVTDGEQAIWLYPGAYDYESARAEGMEFSERSFVASSFGITTDAFPNPTAELGDRMTQAALDFVDACATTDAEGCPGIPPEVADAPLATSSAGAANVTYGARDIATAITVSAPVASGAKRFWSIRVQVSYADDLSIAAVTAMDGSGW